jgi:hypothetical protein
MSTSKAKELEVRYKPPDQRYFELCPFATALHVLLVTEEAPQHSLSGGGTLAGTLRAADTTGILFVS